MADFNVALTPGPLEDCHGDLKGFHVRLHQRGFKGVLSTPREERFLDETLLAALEGSHIDFDDPDFVIQIETIDGRVGMSLWTRDELQRCPFLGVN